MISSHLRKIGGSTVITIPSTILKLLNIEEGQKIALTIENGKIVLEPLQHEKKYKLKDLLNEHETMTLERDAWDEMPVMGRELL